MWTSRIRNKMAQAKNTNGTEKGCACKGKACTSEETGKMHTPGPLNTNSSNWSMVNLDKVSPERKDAFHTVVSKLNEADQLWAIRGNKNVALQLYQEAYELAKVAENEMLQATVGMGLGYGLLEVGLPKQALEKFTHAYEVAQKHSNVEQSRAAKEFISIALQNINHAEVLELLAATRATKSCAQDKTSVQGNTATVDIEDAPLQHICKTDGSKDAAHPPEDEEDAVDMEQQVIAADRNMEELLHSEEKQVRVKRKHKQKQMKKLLKAEEARRRLFTPEEEACYDAVEQCQLNIEDKGERVRAAVMPALERWTQEEARQKFKKMEIKLNLKGGVQEEQAKAFEKYNGKGSLNCPFSQNDDPSSACPGLREEVPKKAANLASPCFNREVLLRHRLMSTGTKDNAVWKAIALASVGGRSDCVQSRLSQSSVVSEPMYINLSDEQSDGPLSGSNHQKSEMKGDGLETDVALAAVAPLPTSLPLPKELVGLDQLCSKVDEGNASNSKQMRASYNKIAGDKRGQAKRSSIDAVKSSMSISTYDNSDEQSDASISSMTTNSVPKTQTSGVEPPPGLAPPPGLELNSNLACLRYPGSIDAPMKVSIAPRYVGSAPRFVEINHGEENSTLKVECTNDYFFKRPIPKFCPYCGHGCEPNFRSCNSCGASVSWIMQG